MARYLDRTTKQWVFPNPDYGSVEGAIRNPDLSGVDDIPQARWIIEGDAVRAPNSEETAAFDAADLVAAKHAKIQAIDDKTSQMVTAGVTVATGKVISTSLPATQNLQNLWIGFQQGIVTLPKAISTQDGGTYTITDNADLIRIAGVLRDFQLTILEGGQSLRAQVLACTSIAEVEAVEDNR